MARAYAREGARVFLVARNRAGLETVARDIKAAGGRAEIATAMGAGQGGGVQQDATGAGECHGFQEVEWVVEMGSGNLSLAPAVTSNAKL